MTIRERLESQMFRARAGAVGFWLLFVACFFLPKDSHHQVLQLVSFAGFAGSVLYIALFVKCPKCGARLGPALSTLRRPNFCPNCGIGFDARP